MEGGLYGYQRSNLGPGGMPKPPQYPATSNTWQDDGQLVGQTAESNITWSEIDPHHVIPMGILIALLQMSSQ